MQSSVTVSSLDPRRWWALTVMVAAQFIYVLDAFIVNVAVPAIRADLRASPAEIEAVIAVYQVAYASVVITGGRLGDIFGQKRLFLTGSSPRSRSCSRAPSGAALMASSAWRSALAAPPASRSEASS